MGKVNALYMAKKIKEKLPSISVCIPTFNSEKTVERCLRLIREQSYPQDKIEIILGDGGSSDGTFDIGRKYKARIVSIPKEKQHAEYNRGVAFNKAKNELALIVDHDNFLPYKHWLRDMVEPLVADKEVVASSTCYYDYDKKYDIMDRYFALYGASEPLPYFLKKTDRLSQVDKMWNLFGKASDCGKYFIVEFDPDPRKFPSIGSNGCLMRKDLVLRNAKADPDNHYPIDVLYDVCKKGHNKFAFVKNSIIHLTHSRGLWEFLKRRKRFVEQYHFEEHSKRRWSVVMPGDEFNLFLFVIYSLTIIGPLITALKGYIKIKDPAWFIHPVMCLGTTIIYGWVFLRFKLTPIINKG